MSMHFESLTKTLRDQFPERYARKDARQLIYGVVYGIVNDARPRHHDTHFGGPRDNPNREYYPGHDWQTAWNVVRMNWAKAQFSEAAGQQIIEDFNKRAGGQAKLDPKDLQLFAPFAS